MPPVIVNDQIGEVDLRQMKEMQHEYAYPNDLDLSPWSDQHKKLVRMLMERAMESRAALSKRFESWNQMDNTLTAFVTLDEQERIIKEKDARKPVSVVVPMSYAQLETILTYMTAAFLKGQIFYFDPTGPEDTLGAALLEQVIDYHCRAKKAALALHTMYRDAFSKGFGAIYVKWTEERGKLIEWVEPLVIDLIGNPVTGPAKKKMKSGIIFEGNCLENIDPYNYLPDPNVAIQDVQDGEYVGWLCSTNYLKLLEYEESGYLFNVRYMSKCIGGYRSALMTQSGTTFSFGRDDQVRKGQDTSQMGTRRPIDVIYMYVNLIPEEWELGSGTKPEKWLFGIAGDRVIILAQKVELAHNKFPIAVCAPDYDGYSVAPISRLEVLGGLQETMDWLFSSHVHNVRKALNDSLVVDPSLININDLEDPQPGKLIRMRRSAWGRGVKDAVQQLVVTDVTRTNIADASYLADIMQRVSGASDFLQGIRRESGERQSAQEARGTQQAALSRLEKAARIISLMAMQDIGFFMAEHTRQFMTEDVYVKIVGRFEDDLRKELNLSGDISIGLPATPRNINVSYDVRIRDAASEGGVYGDTWMQLFQIIMQNVELGQQFDVVRIFRHIARIMGANNLSEFTRMNPQILPTQQVQQQAQAGNIVPIESIPNG